MAPNWNVLSQSIPPSTKINEIGICYLKAYPIKTSHDQIVQRVVAKLLNILISKPFHHWSTLRLWGLHHNFHLHNIYSHLDCWVFCWDWLAFSGVPSLFLSLLKSWNTCHGMMKVRKKHRGLVQFVPTKKKKHKTK